MQPLLKGVGVTRIRKGGKGSLVLIHGAGGNHSIWFPITQHPWPSDLVLLDLPGHGKARQIPPATSLSSLAGTLAEVVQTWERPRIVVGHSLGGTLALALTDQVELDGIGMIASAVRFPPREKPGSPEIACRRLFHSEAFRSRCIQYFSRFLDPDTVLQDLKLAASIDLSSLARRVQIPVLFLWARHDGLLPYSLALEARSLFPNRYLVYREISGGHMVVIENPQGVSDELKDFLHHVMQTER